MGMKSPVTRWPDLFREMAYMRGLHTFYFATLHQTSDGRRWETMLFIGEDSDESACSVARDREGVQTGLQRFLHGGIRFVADDV